METPLHSYLLPASICRSFSPPCAGSEVASNRSFHLRSVSLPPLTTRFARVSLRKERRDRRERNDGSKRRTRVSEVSGGGREGDMVT